MSLKRPAANKASHALSRNPYADVSQEVSFKGEQIEKGEAEDC